MCLHMCCYAIVLHCIMLDVTMYIALIAHICMYILQMHNSQVDSELYTHSFIVGSFLWLQEMRSYL